MNLTKEISAKMFEIEYSIEQKFYDKTIGEVSYSLRLTTRIAFIRWNVVNEIDRRICLLFGNKGYLK